MSEKKYVTNFDILDETVWVKDEDLTNNVATNFESTNTALNNLDLNTDSLSGKTIAIIGSSNADGTGWWQPSGQTKDETNDGFAVYLRQKGATVRNFAVGGSGIIDIDGLPTYEQQFNAIVSAGINPDILIIWMGYNDLLKICSATTAENASRFGYPNLVSWNALTGNTWCDKFDSLLRTAKVTYPECKVIVCLRTSYIQNMNKNLNYFMSCCTKIARKYFIPIFDMDYYCQAPINIPELKAVYYAQDGHFNEKMYMEVIGPALHKFIINNDIGVNYKDSDLLYTNVPILASNVDSNIDNAITNWLGNIPFDNTWLTKAVCLTDSGAQNAFMIVGRVSATVWVALWLRTSGAITFYIHSEGGLTKKNVTLTNAYPNNNNTLTRSPLRVLHARVYVIYLHSISCYCNSQIVLYMRSLRSLLDYPCKPTIYSYATSGSVHALPR